jgi:hypothetical protein
MECFACGKIHRAAGKSFSSSTTLHIHTSSPETQHTANLAFTKKARVSSALPCSFDFLLVANKMLVFARGFFLSVSGDFCHHKHQKLLLNY